MDGIILLEVIGGYLKINWDDRIIRWLEIDLKETVEIYLKDTVQMQNRKPKILTAEFYILSENCEQFKHYQQSKVIKIHEYDCSTTDLWKIKMILNTSYWCDHKMGQIFIKGNLAEFKLHIPMGQFQKLRIGIG